MTKQETSERISVSRRKAMTQARLLLGATAVAMLPGTVGEGLAPKEEKGKRSEFPWGYKKIDPQRAGQIATYGLPALVDTGHLSREVLSNFLAEWEVRCHDPATIFFSSPVMEVVGRRPAESEPTNRASNLTG